MNALFYINCIIIGFLIFKLILRLYSYFYLIGKPDTVVYLKRLEEVYHTKECPLLDSKPIKASLIKVYYHNYAACEVCNPPVLKRQI